MTGSGNRLTLAAILTGEPITPALLAGGAVILAGVYVGVYARAGQAGDASFPVTEGDA
jgi:drug/metabolite transporter (DMT)-like permease